MSSRLFRIAVVWLLWLANLLKPFLTLGALIWVDVYNWTNHQKWRKKFLQCLPIIISHFFCKMCLTKNTLFCTIKTVKVDNCQNAFFCQSMCAVPAARQLPIDTLNIISLLIINSLGNLGQIPKVWKAVFWVLCFNFIFFLKMHF